MGASKRQIVLAVVAAGFWTAAAAAQVQPRAPQGARDLTGESAAAGQAGDRTLSAALPIGEGGAGGSRIVVGEVVAGLLQLEVGLVYAHATAADEGADFVEVALGEV